MGVGVWVGGGRSDGELAGAAVQPRTLRKAAREGAVLSVKEWMTSSARFVNSVGLAVSWT